VINPPANYGDLIGPSCPELVFVNGEEKDIDLVHIFTNSKNELEGLLKTLHQEIKPNGMVWVSWYKKTAKKSTEITEDFIREVALPLQWVDVKVCAVDDDWSGLKLVIPLKSR
jgi:hypothetical protein